jgi:hypothetical protein
VKVAAIFGFVQHFTRFGERRLRQISRRFYRTFFSKKIEFVPIFPCFERFAGFFTWKSNAKSLIDMQSDDLDASAAGKVRSLFPERAVRRVVEFSDT